MTKLSRIILSLTLAISILSSIAIADDGSVVLELTFNSDGIIDNSTNPINFTTYGSLTFSTTTKHGTHSWDLDGSTNYLAITGYTLNSKLNLNSSSALQRNMTVVGWLAFDNTNDYNIVFGFQGHGGGCTEGACGFDLGNWPAAGNTKSAEGRIASTPSVQAGCQNAGTKTVATEMNMWAWRYDGVNFAPFLNTTQTCTSAGSSDNYFPNNAGFFPKVGFTGSNQNVYTNMKIAHLCVINASLNDSQLAEYYNSGNGQVPCGSITGIQGIEPSGPPQPDQTHLTINALDYYDGGTISNFSITAYNSTHSFTNATTSGTLQFGALANLSTYTANITSNHSGGYFNQSASVIMNLATSHTFRLWQSELVINATKGWNGSAITAFNVSVPSQFNQSNSSGQSKLLLKAGSYTLRAATNGLLNTTQDVTITALQQSAASLEFFFGYLNVTTKKAILNTSISAFNITATYPNGLLKNFSTTNGYIYFGIDNSTYNITAEADTYVTQSRLVPTNQTAQNYTFYLQQANSVTFRFKDQITLTTILNANLELISDLFADNFTTTTGNLTLELIQPEAYIARFSSLPDYEQHLYAFTLTNGTFQEITLYMLNSSQSTDVTATVIDETATAVEGAQLHVLRYDISSNSYITTEILITNFDGKAIFRATSNTEFYKFMVVADGEFKPIFPTLSTITDPTFIFSTNLNFQILLGTETASDFYTTEKISYQLVFNDATNNFRFTYGDPAGITSQGCLYLYTVKISATTLINSSCASSASSTILLPVNAINGTTYRADAYVTVSGSERFLTSALKEFKLLADLGRMGLFIVFLIALVLLFMGVWDITLPVITLPVWIFIATIIGLLDIPLQAAIALLILGIVLFYALSHKRK